MASRDTDNATIRYSILGLQSDILEVLSLCEQGGAGPLGPGHERLYWNGEEGRWTSETPAPAGDPC